MGAFTSRQRGGVEEPVVVANDAYKYPPKSGSFFGKYFIMGGERFDTPQPEAYLFGENADLNFLGCRPIPFPYPAPQPNEPTKTLKSLVNVRKESLRFVRAQSDSVSSSTNANKAATSPEAKETQRTQYNIEFTFDSDARCAITILYFCTEEISPNGVVYTPKDPSMNSETFHYKRGANQQFNQVSHVFDPSQYSDGELNYSLDKEVMPIVIRCVAEEGDDPKQSHVTIAVVEKSTDSSYVIKPLKQKQFVDGLCYLLQEIYGIENKNAETYKTVGDEEIEDNGSECVICMSETRDTLILPCRHLCLCNCCADSLRYQANNCPICRSPFRALLQIRALRKSTGPAVSHGSPSDCQVNIPSGYEMVSLIEALNGPTTASHSHPLTVHIPSLPPLTAVALPPTQQDAITSPSIPVRGDIATSRPFAGSFSSLQVLAATEDSSAQTDCPMAPAELVSPMADNSLEVSLSIESPELGAQGDCLSPDFLARNASPSKSSTGRCSPMSDPVDGTIRDISTLTTQADSTDSTEDGGVLMEAQSLLEVRSPAAMLSRVESKALSMSTPDSLHLCDSRDRSSKDLRPDVSPVGEDSDYYTPEDPNLTIFSDHQRSAQEAGSSGAGVVEEDEECDANRGGQRNNPPSYLEAVSLPGTPLSHGSNRSSGDSFSSMSSTRLLLPNRSHETLAEDSAIP